MLMACDGGGGGGSGIGISCVCFRVPPVRVVQPSHQQICIESPMQLVVIIILAGTVGHIFS